MKVQLLVNVQDVGKDGDVVDVKKADADQLIWHGFAREVSEPAPAKTKAAKASGAKSTSADAVAPDAAGGAGA